MQEECNLALRTGSFGRAVPSSGFTLLEVVVTMTILGFILLIIFGAFRLGLSAWDEGEQTREEYQRQRTATQLITRQIKSDGSL